MMSAAKKILLTTQLKPLVDEFKDEDVVSSKETTSLQHFEVKPALLLDLKEKEEENSDSSRS